MGPVNHSPAGIITTPPPFAFILLIALLMDWVLTVDPFAIAPNNFMLMVSFLKDVVATVKFGSFCADRQVFMAIVIIARINRFIEH